ncbi:hypothetical protein CEQ90_06160 [Lewinellaceae bacterium SD302]|nr:hypothetical protein CEQ90_06160 [Lewinellaceae bacterium SD302]
MKNLLLLALAGLLVGATSCESVVEDLNKDPNNFTDISTTLIVNHTILNTVTVAEAESARNAGMWVDQFTGSDRQYITLDNYGIVNADFDAPWADFYRGGLSQAEIGIQKATEENAPSFLGISQIMKGYYAAEAALQFGDVPFSQAADAVQFPDPVYDGQREVINQAIALLDEGAANVGSLAITGSGTNNVLNTSSSWDQLANALKARYLLSVRDYAGALDAAQDAGFDAASNSVDIIHTTSNFAENLFYQFEAEQRTDYLTFTGSFLIDVLSDTTDVSRTTDKTNDSNRRSFFSYDDGEFVRLNTNIGGFFAADMNFPLVGYPEVQLIIAESAARTGDEELAISSLNNARNYWDGVMGTDDYADLDEDDFDDEDDLINAILLEKFVSVFGLPTFHDVVRTDNAIGTYLDGRDAPLQRFLYPSTEASSNSNYPGLIGLDVPTPINN